MLIFMLWLVSEGARCGLELEGVSASLVPVVIRLIANVSALPTSVLPITFAKVGEFIVLLRFVRYYSCSLHRLATVDD
jgi:hypothetical protein